MLNLKHKGRIGDLLSKLNLEVEKSRRKIGLLGRIRLEILGYVKVGEAEVETLDGRRSVTSLYLARCGRCKKLYVDVTHSFHPYLLCPYCGERQYIW